MERPAVCPLFSNLPLVGEGFLAWFLRRFSSASDATAGRTLRLEGRELILVPKAGCASPFPLSLPIAKAKRFAGTASESPDASGWEVDKIPSPAGGRVSHPCLESALFVSAKPFLEGRNTVLIVGFLANKRLSLRSLGIGSGGFLRRRPAGELGRVDESLKH